MEEQSINFESDKIVFSNDEEVLDLKDTENVWKLMIVDDDIEVHNVTRLVLSDFTYKGKGLQFISAYSGHEAKKIFLANPDTALILLDVVMEEDDSGLNVVKFIREEISNQFVRIVLRTGQPGQSPEESVILTYDINDYRAKTELTSQKLFTTLVTSLRSYQAITSLEEARTELKFAWEKAEEMNRLKNCFLSNMHHELRTPLNGIMGFSSLLDKQIKNIELKSYIKIIQDSGDRLLNTLNDILELVSIEAGNKKLEVIEINFADECKPLLKIFESQAQGKNLAFNYIVDDPEVNAKLDPKLFSKIIASLMSNAIKFTSKGEINVIIRRLEEEESSSVLFIVNDTGVGIDKNFLPNIFDAFKQESTGDSRTFEGNGIGLTIMKQLTELIGADVIAESEKGIGTTMTLKFPASN